MVKNVAAIVLHAIAGDMECWTSGTKELASNFLLTLMLFVESNITMHLQPLVKLMHRALAEPTIATKVNFFLNNSSHSISSLMTMLNRGQQYNYILIT